MAKRSRDEVVVEYDARHKRSKISPLEPLHHPSSTHDRLSRLPDELVIRILSFLSETELLRCHFLSHKYYRLCEDGDLWRAHYYESFVRPRVRRLKGIKDLAPGSRLLRHSRHANWLEDAYLLDPTNKTNWKRQFRLRCNWTNGNCTVHDIIIDQVRGVTSPLAQLHDGRLYTVDERAGLRVWNTKKPQELVARISLKDTEVPSALTIESGNAMKCIRILVGFSDGKIIVFSFQHGLENLSQDLIIQDDRDEQVTAIKVVWPFVLTMAKSKDITLYQVKSGKPTLKATDDEPVNYKLLHRLQSRIGRVPLSMSLRVMDTTTLLSIAFTTHSVFDTCTVGIQEVQISHASKKTSSRLYYAVDEIHPLFNAPPTSMSYNHPYLLVSNADNTLTMYLVRSDSQSLSIGSGNRLWGHTSAVSSAHVGPRGRAVSVSKIGGELRVWELEGGVVSNSSRRRLEAGEMSVRVQPRAHAYNPEKEPNLDAEVSEVAPTTSVERRKENVEIDVATKRQWVGFDEENVAVLQEGRNGEQMLVIYNFA